MECKTINELILKGCHADWKHTKKIFQKFEIMTSPPLSQSRKYEKQEYEETRDNFFHSADLQENMQYALSRVLGTG